MNNIESNREKSSVDEFMQNPEEISDEIWTALESGNLNPAFAEKHLSALIKEARVVNLTNQEAYNEKMKLKIETTKNKLLVKLATFEGEQDDLAVLLENFCQENNLDLFPKKDWAVGSKKDIKSDWISPDGQIAIIVNPDNIYVYERLLDKWIGKAL